ALLPVRPSGRKTFACQKTLILAVLKGSGIYEHWKTGRTARRNRKNTGSGAIPAMIGSFPEFENCLHDLCRTYYTEDGTANPANPEGNAVV
ncbi:MAG: hypothetical protein ACRECY_11165, partial [Phyllobacterium sp.]